MHVLHPMHACNGLKGCIYWNCIYDVKGLWRGGDASQKIYELKYFEIERVEELQVDCNDL